VLVTVIVAAWLSIAVATIMAESRKFFMGFS